MPRRLPNVPGAKGINPRNNPLAAKKTDFSLKFESLGATFKIKNDCLRQQNFGLIFGSLLDKLHSKEY